MDRNIFLGNMPKITFEQYLEFNEESRENMGPMIPVPIYRLLEYSIREELCESFGKEVQIGVFRKAGYRAGCYFARHILDLTVSEDADCSGLPLLGETVCNYDEGLIAGIFSTYTGKEYTAVEVDCWATGDRVCRFCVNQNKEK